LDENYKYWRENGAGWFKEYERRKSTIPYFHIQELFITQLVANAAPAKVLEYGCGVGRHLRNLSRIANIDANGYDQSPTMVADMANWATPEFVKSHVHVGPPVAPLPYADGEFDIVYTCEVLVHTRPEDVRFILAELMRVSKRLVFHLEPDPSTPLTAGAHHGCWGHDLAAMYRELSAEPLVLDKAFPDQLPILVPRGDHRAEEFVPFSEHGLRILRTMDEQLNSVLKPAVEDGVQYVDWACRGEALHERFLSKSADLNHFPRAELARRLAHHRELLEYVAEHGAPNPALNVPSLKQRLEIAARGFWNRSKVRLEVIEKNPASGGNEVWIRHAWPVDGAVPLSWPLLRMPSGWGLRYTPGCTGDLALMGSEGVLELPGGTRPSINFMRHPYSGKIRLSWRGKEKIVDLYRATADDHTVSLCEP
jgi:SAM-dependent methyltransferase